MGESVGGRERTRLQLTAMNSAAVRSRLMHRDVVGGAHGEASWKLCRAQVLVRGGETAPRLLVEATWKFMSRGREIAAAARRP